MGWIVSEGNRSIKVAGELRLPDATMTAECRAVVVRTPEETSKLLEPEKVYWIVSEH